MLDLTTERHRIVSASLGLAAERPWGDVTLADIADRAATTLVALKAHFSSKGEIVSAFASAVDDEVLRRAPRRRPDEAARDVLFEVVMSRFDALEPWKAALRSIAAAGPSLDPTRIEPFLASQRWMLEAAGIGTDGVSGGARVAGLASIYASVFRTWLDDDDPGLARTMAALDRRLRRGEQTLRQAEDVLSGLERAANAVWNVVASATGAGRSTGSGAAGGPSSSASSAASSPTAPPPARAPGG